MPDSQSHCEAPYQHSTMPHGHHHSVSYNELSLEKRQKMRRRLLLAICINIGITLMEIIVGLWVNSMALLSDALHNFSDVLALVLSLIGLYLLNRKAQNTQTFGYERIELVIGLINAISLIFIGLLALRPAVEFFIQLLQDNHGNIGNNRQMMGLPIFIASLISLVLNGLCVYILERGEHHSVSLRSSMLHLFSDMLTSVAVCIAGVMIYLWGLYWVDPIISIGIGLYIIISSYKLAKYSIQILLNFNVTGLQVKDISELLCCEPEVAVVSHIHLWSLSESVIMLEANVGVARELCVSELMQLNTKLKERLSRNFHISHVTLEFYPFSGNEQQCQLAGVAAGRINKAEGLLN